MPPDAAVFRGAMRLGRTPLTIELSPGERVTLKLAKGCCKDTTVTLTGSGDRTQTVTLPRKRYGGEPDDEQDDEDLIR